MKFKMPTKSDLKGRTSTISNAFAISVTPYIVPSEEEVKKLYQELDIKEGQCAYCLGNGNCRDHLKPLVKDGMPTGYITDITNIIPCCQACNSSKGSKDFESWYKSNENLMRLKKLGLTDEQIDHRFEVVCAYEENVSKPLDYESLVGQELWNEYKERKNAMIQQLKESQKFCDDLNKIILSKIKKDHFAD